ncbi:PIG-L deacetylase family protein [Chelativorans sp.]|uniref:PIG-L deacetylase family protein n=1 Tax=Chelativorans sp. TaxID=2203393 RepID=UPI002811E3F3|nr:PIG-L deacetylase family protein [Chelativorans sp.]
MRILAVGAHPDDIEIFMFGTLAAFSARGATLHFAIATDGALGGRGDRAELSRTRKAEAGRAAALLSADFEFLDFPDGGLSADAELIGVLKAHIGRIGPDLVLTHWRDDYHGDHRALSEAVRIASSFAAPVLYADTIGGVGFAPTHYVDISSHFPLKLDAIRAHVSQDPERFVQRLTVHNGFRAMQCNAPAGSYAEAWRFEPIYPFADIRDLLPPAPPVRPVGDRSRPPS